MRAILDDRARLQRMLDFEVALARAEAAVGVIPALAIDQIANAAKAERYDVKALGEEAVASGNIAIPLINALTAEVAKSRRIGRRLRSLGGDQPGRHRHRAGARAQGGHRRSHRRSQPRHRRLHRAHRAPSPHRRGRAHLDAARAADAVRAQARGLCGGAGTLARAAAAAAARSAGAAIRRRGRHARRAQRSRPRRRRAAGRPARPAAAGGALAHPPRPAGRGRVGVGDPRRHLRQDRPRRLAPDADRRGRSFRAGGARARRLVDHAAQAQSDRRCRGARGRDHRAQSTRDHHGRAGAGARARRSAAGRPNGRPSPRSRSSPRARSTPSSTSPRAWKSTASACASILRKPAE